LLVLIGQSSFPIMVRPIQSTLIRQSLEEAAVRAGHEVLMVVDLYISDCWWSTRDFRTTAQASPYPLIKSHYYINKLYYYIKNTRTVTTKARSGTHWGFLLCILAVKSWWNYDYISRIVCETQGISDQQLMPHPNH
jgi:uncharacterized membrane protein (GlpM family)